MYNTNREARTVAIKQIVDREIVHDGIKLEKSALDRLGLDLGQLVVIKSCHGKDPDEAIMGIFVGSVLVELGLGKHLNPVFFVPKLGKTLAGYESWWQSIPKEDEQLSCDAMKTKYHFTWDDIKQQLEERLDMLSRTKPKPRVDNN